MRCRAGGRVAALAGGPPPAGTPPHSPQSRQRDAACGQRSPPCVPREESAPPSPARSALCAPVSGWRQGPSRCSSRSLAPPTYARVQRAKTLVSNTKQTHGTSVAHVAGAVGGSKFSPAQRVPTGENVGVDSLPSAQVHIKEHAGIDEENLSICSADASDQLQRSYYVLTNPCSVMSGRLNAFNAHSNATLEKVHKHSFVAGTTPRSLPNVLRVNCEFPGQVK